MPNKEHAHANLLRLYAADTTIRVFVKCDGNRHAHAKWEEVIADFDGRQEFFVRGDEPDSINWNEVSRAYNWMCRDMWGSIKLYKSEPFIIDHEETSWDHQGTYIGDAKGSVFASYSHGTRPWQESKVKRPT